MGEKRRRAAARSASPGETCRSSLPGLGIPIERNKTHRVVVADNETDCTACAQFVAEMDRWEAENPDDAQARRITRDVVTEDDREWFLARPGRMHRLRLAAEHEGQGSVAPSVWFAMVSPPPGLVNGIFVFVVDDYRNAVGRLPGTTRLRLVFLVPDWARHIPNDHPWWPLAADRIAAQFPAEQLATMAARGFLPFPFLHAGWPPKPAFLDDAPDYGARS